MPSATVTPQALRYTSAHHRSGYRVRSSAIRFRAVGLKRLWALLGWHLRDLETTRRYATLVAVVLEAKATVIDAIVDLHDRIIGALFNRAKHSHEQQFQQSGKAINEKVRLYWRIGHALLEAKQSGSDPFAAIESVIWWDAFTQSVTEAEKLSQPEDFDYLHRIGDRYSQIRRYAPALLEALRLKAAPAAQDILKAVETLKSLNADNTRKVPKDAPTSFIKRRWESLVFTADGVDRRFYELCTLSELKNALRSGDIWVQGSRQFKDFDEYLLPAEKVASLRQSGALPLAVVTDCERYLRDRLLLLEQQMETVNQLAKADALPDAIITDSGLKITPLTNSVPEAADALMQKAYALLPHSWVGNRQLIPQTRKCRGERNRRLTTVRMVGVEGSITIRLRTQERHLLHLRCLRSPPHRVRTLHPVQRR